MRFLILIFALYFVSVVSAQQNLPKYGQLEAVACNNKKQSAVIKKFEVAGCTSQPCTFERGKDAALNIEFVPNRKITNLKLQITGIIGNKEIPFNSGEEDNHCKKAIKHPGAKCNLLRGKTYKYSNSISVLKQYPQISVSVRYSLVDQSNQQVFCVQWQTKIV